MAKLATVVSKQFPEFIRSDYPAFIEFVKAYYRWLQDNGIGPLEAVTSLDTTLDEFVEYFNRQYDPNSVKYANFDQKLLIKNIKQLYTAKGSEASFDFFFRAMFNAESEIRYPWHNTLKVSDGKWQQDLSILVRVDTGDGLALQDKIIEIIGTDNLPYQTFVSSVVKYSEDSDVYECFIDRTFRGRITYDCPLRTLDNTITGVMQRTTSIAKVDIPGSGFGIGQLFRINSYNGTGTIVKIKAIDELTGAIKAVEIIDFGIGYNTGFTAAISPQDAIQSQASSMITLALDVDGNGPDPSDLAATYPTREYISKSEAGIMVHHDYTNPFTNYVWASEIAVNLGDVLYHSGRYYSVTEAGVTGLSGPTHEMSDVVLSTFGVDSSVTQFAFIGDVSVASKTITNVSSVAGLYVGLGISGAQIPSGSYITALGASTITISKTPVSNATGASFNAFEVDIARNVLCAPAHGLVNGTPLKYDAGTSPIGGLVNGNTYFVKDATLNTFRLAHVSGGNAVEMTSVGTGTQEFLKSVAVVATNGTATLTYIGSLPAYFLDLTYVGDIWGEFKTQESFVDDTDYAVLRFTIGGLCRYPGYYNAADGMLDDAMYIQDSYYYQLFSYVTQVSEELDTYKSLVKKVLHPIGTALFGDYAITHNLDASPQVESALNILLRDGLVQDTVLVSHEVVMSLIKAFTDTVSAPDTQWIHVTKPLTALVGATEDETKTFTKNKASAVVTSHTEAFDFTKNRTESLTTTNPIYKTVTKAPFTESKTVTDGQALTFTKAPFAETKTVTDDQTLSVTKNKFDSITVNGNEYTFTFTKNKYDTVTIYDDTNLTGNFGKIVTDNIVTSNPIYKTFTRSPWASTLAGITDFFTYSQTKGWGDNLYITEELSFDMDKYMSAGVATTSNYGVIYRGPYYADGVPWVADYMENSYEFTN